MPLFSAPHAGEQGASPLHPHIRNMLHNIYHFLVYYKKSPYLCTSLRIVGNAEERPMNVKAALTTERGEDVKTLAASFLWRYYQTILNIPLIRIDKL